LLRLLIASVIATLMTCGTSPATGAKKSAAVSDPTTAEAPGASSPGRQAAKSPPAAIPIPSTETATTAAEPPKITTSAATMPITSATSLLVVSPHPDDEVLCCSGVIQRVLHAGGHVSIVWFTSGDGSELDLLVVDKSLIFRPSRLRELALRRMQESRNAATTLGVPSDRLYFLGYPDRGILPLFMDYYITTYRSKFTTATAVPYPGTLSPGHPYTGQNLEHDFESVLDKVHPTLVLAPSPRDSHPDHRATGLVTIRVMARRNELSRVRYWIVHGGEFWPIPRGYEPELAMNPPPLGHGLSQTPFNLEPQEELRKRQAISAYHTQMEVMSSFLLSFVRTTELYSTTPMPSN
jgi:LmbE family N-acetylglucosaminyl deacetylase